jgi:ribonucleoside-diphosphate reductase alpha subunit
MEEFDEREPYVINRSGDKECAAFGKITDRVRTMTRRLRLRCIDRIKLEKEVISRFKSGMKTTDVDKLVIEACRSYSAQHPDYTALAGGLIIDNLQKVIQIRFVEVYRNLSRPGIPSRFSAGFLALVEKYADVIEERIVYDRDLMNAGFSAATLVRSYLSRDPETEEIAELPQHMYMRVALSIHCMEPSGPYDTPGGVPVRSETRMKYCMEEAFRVYDLLSTKQISHASPTIFNAGTLVTQYASCFKDAPVDTFENIYKVISDTATMSKRAGGVSISLDRVRVSGQIIKSTGGRSSGIDNLIPILQRSQRFANQTHRPGAFAMYLSVFNAGIATFLEMPLPKGPRYEQRDDGRLLKYGIMIPDRFMMAYINETDVYRRIAAGEKVPDEEHEKAGDWYLFSPDDQPYLVDVYDERSLHHPDGPGGSFSTLYDHYVATGNFHSKTKTSVIVKALTKAISLTGNPYMLFKDSINRQNNLAVPSVVKIVQGASGPSAEVTLGTSVIMSNLCTEITIPIRRDAIDPSNDQVAVCTLAAINLQMFVERDLAVSNNGQAHGCRMKWPALIDAVSAAINNLDLIIDLNRSGVAACERSCQYYRPLGLGVMGLADVFHMFGYSYGSKEALELDFTIFMCIYFAAMRQSSLLGAEKGNFTAFADSETAKGFLQPDLAHRNGTLDASWAIKVEEQTAGLITVGMWDELRESCRHHLRNGLVTAVMPTATSSNAVGVNESVEPFTTNMYTRLTLVGETMLLNPHLVRILEQLGLWNDTTCKLLEVSGGSVKTWDGADGMPYLSPELRLRFRTVREIPQTTLVEHSMVRECAISQSQSSNHYWDEVSTKNIMEATIMSFVGGVKTASYYNHAMPANGTMSLVKIDPKATSGPESCALGPGGADCEACSV